MGVWKQYVAGSWVAQGGTTGSPASTMSADEVAYWSDRAALLDPAAYVYVAGTSQSVTVPTGRTWYALNLWHVRTSDGTGYQFLRTLDANRAVPLSAGTTLTTDATQLGFMYLCKPELVTTGDARYTDDPKGLYYQRLARLRGFTQHDLSASIAASSAQGVSASSNFPTDFTEGIATLVSQHDVSWLTFTNASGGMNTFFEISDDHEQRVAESVIVPFKRADFPGIKMRAASVTGEGTGFTSLAGYGAVRYVKLPADW